MCQIGSRWAGQLIVMATLVYKSFYGAAEGFEFVRIEPLKPRRCLKQVEGERDSWSLLAHSSWHAPLLYEAVSCCFNFLSVFVSLQSLEIGIVCRTACRIRHFMLKLYRCNVYKNVLQAKREREEWELSITNVFFCRFVQYSESSSSGACNHPMVDYTPPSYITLLFTDLGVLTPSAVSDELIKLYLWHPAPSSNNKGNLKD